MDNKAEYYCRACDYLTDRLDTYNRHINTKKHKKNSISREMAKSECVFCLKKYNKKSFDNYYVCSSCEELNIVKKVSSGFICVFCKKKFKDKSHKNRHYESCSAKVIHTHTNKKITLLEKEKIEMKQQIEKLQDEFNEFLKTVAKNYLLKTGENEAKTINQATINNKCINYYYVLNNFNSAHNIEDLMKPALTDAEKEHLKSMDPLSGCIELIKSRCINDISIERRPFHSLDITRNKFLLRVDNKWCVDFNAEKLIKSTYAKIKELYPIDDTIDLNQKIKNMKNLIEIQDTNKKKIIKSLNEMASLKNNNVDT